MKMRLEAKLLGSADADPIRFCVPGYRARLYELRFGAAPGAPPDITLTVTLSTGTHAATAATPSRAVRAGRRPPPNLFSALQGRESRKKVVDSAQCAALLRVLADMFPHSASLHSLPWHCRHASPRRRAGRAA